MKYTKYEKARIIGARALQIAMGAPILVKMKEEDFIALRYNPVNIARKEFDDNVLPISIKRPLPGNKKT
ncbi:MAG TPA: DNA-directed RNA polymerase subunit K [Candidatus Nanoarchaeia archaeon]|nr:DNA-directed RNA polymerase subunit K [Candidatus Nanoarchaeia archaeon]